jgi:integrase
VRERLEAVGRERALIYKTLVLTGLRKGELASLTVAQLRLDAATPHVELDAGDEKSREGNSLVVRADLADDLRGWLTDRLAALRVEALRLGEPAPPASRPIPPSSTCRPDWSASSTAT